MYVLISQKRYMIWRRSVKEGVNRMPICRQLTLYFTKFLADITRRASRHDAYMTLSLPRLRAPARSAGMRAARAMRYFSRFL